MPMLLLCRMGLTNSHGYFEEFPRLLLLASAIPCALESPTTSGKAASINPSRSKTKNRGKFTGMVGENVREEVTGITVN